MRSPTVVRSLSVFFGFLIAVSGAIALAPSASAAPAQERSPIGVWAGTINWPGKGPTPLTLDVSSNAPFRAEEKFEANSLCRFIMTEKSRKFDGTMTTRVTNQTPGCGALDSDMVLTFRGDKITAYNPDSRSIAFTVYRGLTCAERYARIGEGLPPISEALASALLNRFTALPKWFGTTVLTASCINGALDQRGPDGKADLWKNLNSKEFYSAVCLTAESAFDPLNLGYTKNFFCGASAG